MRIDLSCPVENRGSIVKTNSETDEQYLLLKLLNISEKTITSVKFNVRVYDANGVELATIPVEIDELSAEPKTLFAENKAISLAETPDAKNFVVEITYATFEDEEPYEPSEENTVEVDAKEASVDDAIALRELAPGAVCFAEENDDHWKCVCGRPNFLDSESCVRCGRDKAETLAKFSSKEALDNTVTKIKEAAEKAAEEAAEMAAAEMAAKKAKQRKSLITAGIVVAALIVLVVLGFFGRMVYYNIAADRAAKNGDYTTAYEYYSKTGSSKINEVAGLARGNTPANLMFQGGICTEDSENFYYMTYNGETYHFNLIKENKETKEKQILTDSAAGSLCAVGDYIYFMDMETTGVKRITKDGTKIDTILETAVTHMDVVGNTLYYVQLDYDNPNNLTLEQCQTLASQGQMDSFHRLHKMNIDTKEDTLLTQGGVQTCAIYGDRIYYLTSADTTWDNGHLWSIDLNGKDAKEIVDVPVATFLVKDNTLYYSPMYLESSKGNEIASVSELDYKVIKMDLTTKEKEEMNSEYMTIYLNSSEDSLMSIVVNRAEYIAYYTSAMTGEDAAAPQYSIISTNYETGVTKILLTGDVQLFNVSGDEVICYLTSQGMCRMKTDGSDFEPIYADGTSNPPAETETPELSEDLQELADSLNNQ